MQKKAKLLAGAILNTTLLGGFLFAVPSGCNAFAKIGADFAQDNTLVMSSQNPVVLSQIKTTRGSNLWVKGDSSSGVTWNNGSGKIAISKNGYIQTLTTIHGITKVNVKLVSGEVELFHGFVEPNDLETPMYGVDYVFDHADTYEFTNTLPNRIRIRATKDSVIESITVSFDCVSVELDHYEETIDYGFENAFIDGVVKTGGTDIDKIMPPISRFGNSNRTEKKKRILERLIGFFDRFFGIGE